MLEMSQNWPPTHCVSVNQLSKSRKDSQSQTPGLGMRIQNTIVQQRKNGKKSVDSASFLFTEE